MELAESRFAAWYALRTLVNAEERVKRSLMEQPGVEQVFLPCFAADINFAYRSGKPLFPGYLFVRSVAESMVFEEIARCPHIVYMLGNTPGKPTAVPEAEIESVRRLTATPSIELVSAFPARGRLIRITSGPLIDLQGVVTHASPRQIKVRSLVNVLGRVVEITVRPDQVETLGFYSEPEAKSSRHRAGKRARRNSKKKVNQGVSDPQGAFEAAERGPHG